LLVLAGNQQQQQLPLSLQHMFQVRQCLHAELVSHKSCAQVAHCCCLPQHSLHCSCQPQQFLEQQPCCLQAAADAWLLPRG
jgi:hypothetical protein